MQQKTPQRERTDLFFSDERIIELYWQRKESAIKETDRKYGKVLSGIAKNILHNEQDCEECSNDLYMKIWNSIPPERPVHFLAYMTAIIRNTALNIYNEKNRKKRIPSEMMVSLDEIEEALSAPDNLEELVLNRELGECINEFIKGLSERSRCIFVGRFYLADTLAEIADTLGIHYSTVQREEKRLKQELRMYLEREGYYVRQG